MAWVQGGWQRCICMRAPPGCCIGGGGASWVEPFWGLAWLGACGCMARAARAAPPWEEGPTSDGLHVDPPLTCLDHRSIKLIMTGVGEADGGFAAREACAAVPRHAPSYAAGPSMRAWMSCQGSRGARRSAMYPAGQGGGGNKAQPQPWPAAARAGRLTRIPIPRRESCAASWACRTPTLDVGLVVVLLVGAAGAIGAKDGVVAGVVAGGWGGGGGTQRAVVLGFCRERVLSPGRRRRRITHAQHHA